MPSRDVLVQAWGDHIIGRLRPKAKALFQAGRFVGADDDKAVFGLPNEIHRTRCKEVQGEVETALGDHFGRPVRLELVVDAQAVPSESNDRPTTPSSDRSPGASPGAPAPDSVTAEPTDEPESISAFDESELGEVAAIDNSAESRVLKAFPGAEEVG